MFSYKHRLTRRSAYATMPTRTSFAELNPARLIETMQNSNQQRASASESPSHLAKYLPVLAEAWIFATIAGFLVVRIFGSNLFKHFLRPVGH